MTDQELLDLIDVHERAVIWLTAGRDPDTELELVMAPKEIVPEP